MPDTNYTVATTAQLTGMKTLKQLEVEAIHFGLDQAAKQASAMNNSYNHHQRIGRPMAGLNTSPKTGPEVKEIYFSPVDVNRSRVELSSPLSSPPRTPPEDEHTALDSRMSPQMLSPGSRRLEKQLPCLEQLDRLVKALVDAPMIRKNVQIQLSQTNADVKSQTSEISLKTALRETSPPSASNCSDAASGLSSISSPLTEASKPDMPTDILQQEYEAAFSGVFDVKRAPRATFRGIVLVDPNVEDSTVRMTCKDHVSNTDGMRVGQHCSVSMPNDSCMFSSLRVVDRSPNQQSRVILRIANQVVERKSGNKKNVLVAEVDVTESFTKAALIELLHIAARSGQTLANVEVSEGIEAFPRLDENTCAMQTSILASELRRIRGQFMMFYIVRPKELHENGTPSRMTIPWMSQKLSETVSYDEGREFMGVVVESIGKEASAGEAFTSRFDWDDDTRRLHCVPLVDGSESSNAVWVCFVRDSFDIGYW